MAVVWWVVLPYAAAVSCVFGHVWRYRRDGFLGFLYGPHLDGAQRFGIRAFRCGLPVVFVGRVAEALASGPHSRPEGVIRVILVAAEAVSVPLTMAGAALILVPALIAPDAHARVTLVDRLTLPALIAALVSAVLVAFDANSTDNGYRTAETLFTWARSLVMLRPDIHAMQHAPALYQGRALIVMLIVAIWPFTRLAGILTVPAVRLARQVAQAPYRSASTV
ncbi:respiratory nitrate reductase subunit gamma [Nocardia seriolae]|nr:respiratory nitrate reductase subunit gamma [Nocardia seriolae]MTJ63140.1 hypothetical protein [Nocardia seriolae]MTJ74655.1 hypothetical protein [Nocardia seriolae]MTJ89052.1 hypothetical protein [Nocardia seriolae]MTK33031.1 hypothetical protein [Nocardia seriolae]MTK41036.1 hypothetical protein [Nocardia seriolae]